MEKLYDLLPGYVFLYSERRLTDYLLFCGMDGVIRRVGRRPDGYELEGPDLTFAMQLLDKDGLVGVMKAVRVGDQVQLNDPLFNGCEGQITRIDYRKGRARVDFIFDRQSNHTWISLDGLKVPEVTDLSAQPEVPAEQKTPEAEEEGGDACRP